MHQSNLKRYRINSGFTQDELAELSQISIKTIQRIESGKSTGSTHSLKELAKSLGISYSELQNQECENVDLIDSKIKYLNLSALAGLVIPLGYVLIPLVLALRNNRELFRDIKVKNILSFHILFSIIGIVSVFLITTVFFRNRAVIPLFFPMYYFLALINSCVVIYFSNRLSRNKSIDFAPNLL